MAKNLGFDYYDRSIIAMTAKESNLSEAIEEIES
ncbi:cytidylate kinase-like family protein [Marinisporobacter balticus]|nr:cytidylate kinase-like family protein [Marinisporobacter balticus]